MLPVADLRQTNRAIDVLLFWRNENNESKCQIGLLLDPPYQRGDVWGHKRRVNLIRSILMCVPIPSLIVNDRLGADWPDDYRVAVIDGKQRITTLLMFLDGQLAVPGEWFDRDEPEVIFSDLSAGQQRKFMNKPLAFSEGRLPTLAAEQEVFDLVNFGGLAQGEVDDE